MMNVPLSNALTPDAEMLDFPADVARLRGHLHRPRTQPLAAAVLHGATGVPQRFYQPFAAWLAEQGIACLTYYYRDFGASRTGAARASQATMVDWGLRDQAAAQVALEAAVPEAPVWVIGHSLGALMLPFQPGARRVSRLISVASGTVHFSDHTSYGKLVAGQFWYGPTPAIVALMGCLPGRMFGLSEDLPSGVYWQWRRWCTTRGFYFRDIGRVLPAPDLQAFAGRARFVAVEDDWMTPKASAWRLMQMYPNAICRQKVLRAADYGLHRIGHIAAFARDNHAIWPDLIADD